MGIDSAAATAKWVARMQASGQQITEGVQSVTEAPGAKAAKQAALWLAKLQASQAKWQRNVSAVSLADWQNAMITRGIPAINAGVTAKSSNYQKFADKFYPYLQAGKSKIAAMPKNSLSDGIAKAVAQIQYNAAYTGGNGRS